MDITTTAKKWYRMVEIIIEDCNAKIICSVDGKSELLQFKEQLKRALEDVDNVLEYIENTP